jgi:hypothetical protein
VIDVSDPTTPTLAASYDTPGFTRAVTIDGDYAYMGDGASGLQIIDISDPTAPTLVGNYDTPGATFKAAIAGNHAYLADGNFGLQVVDISDPTTPTLAGSYNTSGNARDIVVAGDHVLIADFASGVIMIDISDPTTPTLQDSYDTPGNAIGVAVAGEHLSVGDGPSGLQVIDIADPTSPTHVGNYTTPGLGRGVTIAGDYAYVADALAGLQVIDISDPTDPTLIGGYDTPNDAWHAAIAGDYAYVGDGSTGLQVIDISDPTNPSLAGGYDTPGSARVVALEGDYAFVTDWTEGLQVIDISDPSSPTLAGGYNTLGEAWGLAVAGDYAYVADGSRGLQVIDVSDPTSPTPAAGYYMTPGQARDIALAGDYAYVADATSGLQIFDISDPTSPALVGGGYDTPGSADGVAIAGDYAYVADALSGLLVLDISNPTNPILAGSYDTPGNARMVDLAGDYAYVADWTYGLQVIQVFQRAVNPSKNIGQSLAISPLVDDIVKVSLSSTQTGTIQWEASADNGGNWQAVSPSGVWNIVASSGSELVWRSAHVYDYSQPAVNPTCTSIDIAWLYEYAPIDSIVDIPGDQGGQVRIHFTRSGYDFSAQDPIASYNVWRRVDSPLTLQMLEVAKSGNALEGSSVVGVKAVEVKESSIAGLAVIEVDGRYFVESDPRLAAAALPPGTWEVIGSFASAQQDQYIYPSATLADSSDTVPYSVYCITAHTTTPGIWFASPPDSGYSVDNIAPGVPQAFAVAYNTGSGNQLTWNTSPEPDFQYYRVYRGGNEDFIPGPGNLVHETASPGWTDPDYDGWRVHYKITALDHVGNESYPGPPTIITGITAPVNPSTFALYQNVPNPFNPSTSIHYDVPVGGGVVTLQIYDVSGRLVRTLIDGSRTPGEKRVTWDARDNYGSPVATGVYFYRMTAPGFENTRKMILLR